MKANKMKIRTQLILGFSIILTLTLIVGIITWNALTNISNSMNKYSDIQKLQSAMVQVRIKGIYFIQNRDPKFAEEVNRLIAELNKLQEESKLRITDKAYRLQVQPIFEEIAIYRDLFNQFSELENRQTEIIAKDKSLITDILNSIAEERSSNTINPFFETTINALSFKQYSDEKSAERWKASIDKAIESSTSEKVISLLNAYKNEYGTVIDLGKKQESTRTQWTASGGKIVKAFDDAYLTQKNDVFNIIVSTTILLISVILLTIIIGTITALLIVKGINQIINNLVGITKELVSATVAGDLSIRGDPLRINSEFQEIIVGINNTLDAVIKPMNVAAEYFDRISKGDIPPKITDTYYGDFNKIKNNLNQCIEAITLLVTDTGYLATAAVEGRLSTRADAPRHQGDFRRIIEGVNDTLDYVILPLNVAAEYVNRISKGDIPSKITDTYNGDFNEIKNNLNQCIDAINLLVVDTHMLSNAVIEGKLYTRADISVHQGNFAKIVEGVNDTINTLVGFLDNMPAPCMIINKDFEVQFMNKAGASLNNTTGQNLYKFKTNCWDHFRTGDCRTHDCACSKVMQTGSETSRETNAKPGIHNLEIAYSAVPLKNKEGNVIGAFEVVVDQTNVKNECRKAQRVGDYQTKQVVRLIDGLKKFAEGDLTINLFTDVADDDTSSAKTMFDQITDAMNEIIMVMKQIVEKTKLIADGDLSVDLKVRSDNDELILSLQEMVRSVSDVVEQVQSAADNIASASEEMSSTAQQISQGASEQASATDQISSSMEEMSSNIQQNKDNSVQTEKISIDAAQGMGKVLKSAQESLKSIKEIAEKISIIGDIAFQTNILALNAAVEAARAGEHGRGFAVVAAEVRKLAERSKIAAEEINVLSKTSVEITEESGNLLQSIIPNVEKTARLVQEITAASIEQNSGANQINKAIFQLSQVTQQNSAGSEEMASSTEELSGQSEQLKELVSFFKISKGSNDHKSYNTKKNKEQSRVNEILNEKSKIRVIKPKGVKLDLNPDKNIKDSVYEAF